MRRTTKTISLQKPTWQKLWEFKVARDARGLSHAIEILLMNNSRLENIIERRRLKLGNKHKDNSER